MIRAFWTRRGVVSLAVAAVALTGGCAAASSRGGGPVPATSAHTPSTSPSPSPAHRRHPQLVAAARWTSTPQGARLQVRPTHYGRAHAATAAARALQQALGGATGPAPELSSSARQALTDQLRCHAAFAPRKRVWNLEIWRPDVGYLATVAHACNP